MKNITFLLTCYVLITRVTCGYSQSELSFTANYQDNYYPLDSILIENINTGSKIVKHYPDTLLNLILTNIDDLPKPDEHKFSLNQNYPNPFEDKTHFNIYLPQNDLISIHIYNLSGKLILKHEMNMPAGNNSFTFTGNEEKIYLLTVRTRNYSAGIKMINPARIRGSKPDLEYNGCSLQNDVSEKNKNRFEYNQGDYLKLTGFITKGASLVLTDTITDNPTQNETYTFQFKKPNRIVILMYHEIVTNEPENEYERNLSDFENDLKYIRNNNYQVLSMEDLLLIKTGELKLISDGVIITFDDGYSSDYNKALPLLSQYNMPATFFIVAEWIGTPDFMTWAEVWLISEDINDDGKQMFSIGSHTSSHPFLEQSAQNYASHQDYLNFLNTELEDSKNWIVDITGQTNIFLSLPYGDGANNNDIIQTAINNGYKGIRTSIWNPFTVNDMNLFTLPAIPILSDSLIDIIENYLNNK